jgi:hypothetical protein
MSALTESTAHLALVGNCNIRVQKALLLKLHDGELHHGRRSYNDCFGSGRITKRKVCDILRYKPYISLIALRSSV